MSARVRSRALLGLATPLGPDVLMPVAFDAHEAISQPYQIHLRTMSERSGIAADELLFKPACVSLRGSDGQVVRHFHGLVSAFAPEGAAERGLSCYSMTVVPRLWFLDQTSDCRVYQNMTAADIVTRLLDDGGVTRRDFRLYGPRAKREYAAQFNETDLQFATRLIEEEGWFYWFEHSDDAHVLVISDANSGFTPLGGTALRLVPDAAAGDTLQDWRRPAATTLGHYKVKDYDPTAPNKRLEHGQPTTGRTDGAPLRDVFRWPAGNFETQGVERGVRHRMEAAEAQVALVEGRGHQMQFVPGSRFTVQADALDSGDYVLRSVDHHATDATWPNTGDETSYANSFTAFTAAQPWRQPLTTARPQMDGLHAAVVLGPKGGEIHTDEHGRVKIRFFWDHRKEAVAGGSVWARVIQPWAGNGWGAQFIPRVGTEVAVAFMDGDLDRPVVVGGLYNGNDRPIFSPAEKTKSGFRTRSSTQGGRENFSEFSFDDKQGSELVLLHAERDLQHETERDHNATVGRNETLDVAKQQKEKIGDGRSVDVANGDALTVRTGDLTIKVSSGAVLMEAMQSITLKVGQNSVVIDQAGITVKGMIVKLEGETMTEVKAPMTTIKGDGMLTLKGGLVSLN